MALGLTRLRVAKKPLVGVISTGDEVIPPDQPTQPGQVRDVNSYSLSALIEQVGGQPRRYGILPDNLDALKDVAARAHAECDMVLITAGSSASVRDNTAEAIASLGAPGVLVHGINIRPGKPTILAICQGKPVIGLPGNPVSALVIAMLFAVPVIEKLLGLRPRPRPTVLARLGVNLSSQTGREEWIPVRLVELSDDRAGVRYRAEPVFGKSNFIFWLAAGDGLVHIFPDAAGVSAGELVEVLLF
ncbi:MAG: molybdopterin molybdotransferase MoeA [Anaerolineales bacterium]|nr:molybdopterin molybdotransferase MoeA [Anaerolineales bacterium]